MNNNQCDAAVKKEYSTKEIQSVILSIAKDIDMFCRKHNITYYLMGGSALGAMRHKGFIPWDDDLDIFMTRNNYERFITLFQQEGDSKKYFLQCENTKEWPLFLSRVCRLGTTMVSNEFKYNLKQQHNVFVDIMCLYSAPRKKREHILQYICSQLLRVNALEHCSFPNRNIFKRVAMKGSRVLVNTVTRAGLIKSVQKFEGKAQKPYHRDEYSSCGDHG